MQGTQLVQPRFPGARGLLLLDVPYEALAGHEFASGLGGRLLLLGALTFLRGGLASDAHHGGHRTTRALLAGDGTPLRVAVPRLRSRIRSRIRARRRLELVARDDLVRQREDDLLGRRCIALSQPGGRHILSGLSERTRNGVLRLQLLPPLPQRLLVLRVVGLPAEVVQLGGLERHSRQAACDITPSQQRVAATGPVELAAGGDIEDLAGEADEHAAPAGAREAVQLRQP
mmetsp:Transcript_37198/g.98446  ORF Transcript_37198/g.98446 Transcript_37198/m.98446 type:complete len:230 (-) Transcript_37198:458-1147(-)